MNQPKSYYKQMLFFIVLSVFLCITTIYFVINNMTSNVNKTVKIEQTTKKEVKKNNSSKQENQSIASESGVSDFVSRFVTTLFNYDDKNYSEQIAKVEDQVSASVWDKLNGGLFFAGTDDKVISVLENTNYFWGDKKDNLQSVIVELELNYTVNKQEMNLKQLIKLDMEFSDDDIVIYKYLLLNNPT